MTWHFFLYWCILQKWSWILKRKNVPSIKRAKAAAKKELAAKLKEECHKNFDGELKTK